MMDRSRIASIIVLVAALFAGAVGSQGCAMWRQHNAQHAQAEADHVLLKQIEAYLNQQIAAAQKR